jgi:hypothetical protein
MGEPTTVWFSRIGDVLIKWGEWPEHIHITAEFLEQASEDYLERDGDLIRFCLDNSAATYRLTKGTAWYEADRQSQKDCSDKAGRAK